VEGNIHMGAKKVDSLGYDMIACTRDRYAAPVINEGSSDDLLLRRLQKSVELTRRPGAPFTIEQPDEPEQGDALDRLKKLLAQTKEMVAQAEDLVASIRNPRDYYAQADGG
jgi:hypothetical protein